jgi:hypothetical protein
MNEFERQLQECLEALAEGRWDLDECVRRFPEHADELRAQLLTALAVTNAYNAEPDAKWARDARRRFLIATGQTIAEATDIEPSPSFFAAARVRFLLAAQRLRQEAVGKPAPRRVPLFGSPMRAVGALAAAAVLFFGFSTYTVATADAALPGDWQYPVKLQTERVRLALAFTEGAERDVKLDIAEERIHEIEQLAAKGRIIGPGELDRLVKQTQPLVEAAESQQLDAEDAARLQRVSARGVEVLSNVEPQVDPQAQAKLAEAKAVSETGISAGILAVATAVGRIPIVITPQVSLQEPTRTPTPAPTQPAESPTSEPTSGSTEPAATPTTETELPASAISVGAVVDLGSVKMYALTAGPLRLLAPSSENGWYLNNLPSQGVPPLITLRQEGEQGFVVVSTVTGDMYWYISPAGDGRFDEVQMRIVRDGQVFIADPAVLRLYYGAEAEIPILIMQSIRLEQPVTETATEVPTVTGTE